MKPIRTAILGYGRSGSTLHGDPLEELDDFKVTAVCDIEKDKLKSAKERYRCAVYTDYQEMLNQEDLDLICIITRSDQHCPMACDTLRAGVPTLVTKPWAVNSEEARRMIDASREGNAPLLPWLPARWAVDYRRLKEIIQSGEIGRVFSIKRSQYGFATRNDWQTRSECGGGILLNWGPHLVDIPLLLAPGKPRSVYGTLRQLMNPNDGEDVFQARFLTDKGVTVDTEWIFAPAGWDNWHILGDRGSVTVKGKELILRSGEPSRPLDPTNARFMAKAELTERRETLEGDLYGDNREIYAHIARAVRKEEPYAVTPEDALILSGYLDGIRESSRINGVYPWDS